MIKLIWLERIPLMKNIFLIVNYNDFDNTYKLYKNIEKYECLDEIIIIDNASKKDCQNKIKQIKNKKLAVLFSEKNNGYGSAINIGCKYIFIDSAVIYQFIFDEKQTQGIRTFQYSWNE